MHPIEVTLQTSDTFWAVFANCIERLETFWNNRKGSSPKLSIEEVVSAIKKPDDLRLYPRLNTANENDLKNDEQIRNHRRFTATPRDEVPNNDSWNIKLTWRNHCLSKAALRTRVTTSYSILNGNKDFLRRFIKQNYNIYIWVEYEDSPDNTDSKHGHPYTMQRILTMGCSLEIQMMRPVILVTHDCLEEAVDEALIKIWIPLLVFTRFYLKDSKGLRETLRCRAVRKAIKSDVAIYTIHTALDNQAYGVSFGLSQSLGLTNTSVLLPKEDTLKKLNFYVPEAQAEHVEMPYLLVLESWVVMMNAVFLWMVREFSSIAKQCALCRNKRWTAYREKKSKSKWYFKTFSVPNHRNING